MTNYQSQLKQRYNQAYRSAKKRAASSGGGGGGGTGYGPEADGSVNFEGTDIGTGPSYASAFSDKSFPYSMTTYQYAPTGEMITEYHNPQTGRTYKMIGDALVVNGQKNSLIGKVYYDALQRTGRFPTDY